MGWAGRTGRGLLRWLALLMYATLALPFAAWARLGLAHPQGHGTRGGGWRARTLAPRGARVRGKA